MNQYEHIKTAKLISQSQYNTLPYHQQKQYRIINRTAYNEVDDFPISMAIGAATDSALLGGNMLGAALGDMMDGDLMD